MIGSPKTSSTNRNAIPSRRPARVHLASTPASAPSRSETEAAISNAATAMRATLPAFAIAAGRSVAQLELMNR